MTPEERKAAVAKAYDAAIPVLETLEELVAAAPMGIPCGELYARLMGSPLYLTLEMYQMLEKMLLIRGNVQKSNNLLTMAKPSTASLSPL